MSREPSGKGSASRYRLSAREPSLLVWLLAGISLVLPWIGLPMALVGVLGLTNGWPYGLGLLIAGVSLVILDVAIDFVWAGLNAGASDDPTLNRGGSSLVGRSVVVAEAISNGRGAVRAGDTVWIAEGSDAAAGDVLRVEAVHGTVLVVGPARASGARDTP